MEKYANKSGDSPITHFYIEQERIKVWYEGGKSYSYSYDKAGKKAVDQMKILAHRGKGLSTFIVRNVRLKFDS